jgi:hypothetical protein
MLQLSMSFLFNCLSRICWKLKLHQSMSFCSKTQHLRLVFWALQSDLGAQQSVTKFIEVFKCLLWISVTLNATAKQLKLHQRMSFCSKTQHLRLVFWALQSDLGDQQSVTKFIEVSVINGTTRFKKHKQLFEYQHLPLLRHLVVKVLMHI